MRWGSKQAHKYHTEFDSDLFRDRYAEQTQLLDLPVAETRFLGKSVSERRMRMAYIAIGIVLAVFLSKAFYAQVVRGAYYATLADSNRIRVTPLIAPRGLITDAKGTPLVRNVPIFDARIVPLDLPLAEDARSAQIEEIARVIGIDRSLIDEALAGYKKNYKYPITVLENIGYEQALALNIAAVKTPALRIETRNQRAYVDSHFSHIIGYEGKITRDELAANPGEAYLFNDRIGKNGLELGYEQALRGEYGFTESEINVSGRSEKVLAKKDAVPGASLTLTIDADLQRTAAEALASQLRKIGKRRGTVILMDPRDGAIRALVSLPDYNNNLFAGGISSADYQKLIDDPGKPLFFSAIRGTYPSGSTIKPLISAAALEEGVITPRTTVMSSGGIWVQDRWFFPDWKAGGHGLTNVYSAIAWSVNTFYYMIGGGYGDFKGLGVDRLTDWYRRGGLGKPTGIDIPGEAPGLVPGPDWKKQTIGEEWYIGDTYHLSIGQGYLLVTPLQVAEFTALFANGGTLYQPHVVGSLSYADGRTETIAPTVQASGFMSAGTVNTVRAGMRQTVTSGSAQYMGNLPVTSAGKTGTAQWATNKPTHAWYAGFAPYEDPELVVVVLLEEGGEGSQTAVPVAHDILNWYFSQQRD